MYLYIYQPLKCVGNETLDVHREVGMFAELLATEGVRGAHLLRLTTGASCLAFLLQVLSHIYLTQRINWFL